VAATTRALLEQPVVRRWLAALAGLPDLDPVQCDRLAFLAALHDVGKVNIGFQNKQYLKAPFRAGHVSPVLRLLEWGVPDPDRTRLYEALTLREIAEWASDPNAFFGLFYAILSHHGRPGQPDPVPGSRYWRRSGSVDPFAEAARLRKEAERWFPRAFDAAVPFPANPAFQHGFNGLLTLADWIASDTALFPFSEEGDGDRFPQVSERAEYVLRRLGLAADAPRRALGAAPPTFSAIRDEPPRELQARLLELPTDEGGSVTVLEAETGAGKTEAALGRFLRLFHAGRVDGLYFALPTRTAATQIHSRVRAAVAKAFPDAGTRPPVVLAVPGYLQVDDARGEREGRFGVRWDGAEPAPELPADPPKLASPGALWPDDDPWSRRWRGWAAEDSKRFLAGVVVVGTIDQVLLSALAVSHSHLRSAGLARHFLVVDEVHASDAYMTAILEVVLARHLGAGGHALLMSATLGAAARERLLGAGRRPPPLPRAAAEAIPYPLVTYAAPPGTAGAGIALARTSEKRVVVERAPIAGDPARIAARALEAARRGARVLVIRNTVRDCVATQEALETLAAGLGGTGAGHGNLLFGCGGVPAPHHSRFAREDRLRLDKEIERRFGKEPAGGGCVAVATQTVQQSLDLDADLMLTDLCPMDVLLQRLGRLFRHGRERPPGFGEARVVVLLPAERDLGIHFKQDGRATGPYGIGTVYCDLRVLEATWRQLEHHAVLELPAMNRALVEATTHPEALQAIADDLGGPWMKHGETMTGIDLAHGRIAANQLARWDVYFPDATFPSDAARIATRLGANDRVAEFETPLPGPFGTLVRRLTLPHWLVKGADVDTRPTEVETEDGAIVFRFGERRYRYDRLGLAALGATDTPTAEEDDG